MYAGKGRKTGARVLMVAALAVCLMLPVVTGASAETRAQATTPKIVRADFTGPIAYDLKSMQTTQFRVLADIPNCWYSLKLKTATGETVVSTGQLPDSRTEDAVITWNGLDAGGRRLTTGVYTWVLTVAKAGQSATATGKVLVSRVCFSVHSVVGTAPQTTSAYMVEGPVNVYAVVDGYEGSSFRFVVKDSAPRVIALDEPLPTPKQMRGTETLYLRGADGVDARGMRGITYNAIGQGVVAWMTFVQ